MNKYIIIAISAILFLAVVGIVLFKFVFHFNKNNPAPAPVVTRREIPEPNVKISKYILTAKVTAINNNEISVTLQRLFAGDKGNYLDVDNKVVKVTSGTDVVLGKLVNNRYAEVSAKLSDIKVGQKLTFYSAENIKIMSVFSPYKIIINQ